MYYSLVKIVMREQFQIVFLDEYFLSLDGIF
jgi:hypothetical protein